ncbi:AHH domain-containing protein [Aquimarina sp. M1]
MKNYIRQFAFQIGILSLLTCFTACQKDNLEDIQLVDHELSQELLTVNGDISYQRIAIHEIPEVKEFLNSKTQNALGKSVTGDFLETPFGKIVLNDIIKVTNAERKGYTLEIIPSSYRPNEFSNLVISEDSNKNRTAKIITYKLDADFAIALQAEQTSMLNFKGQILEYDADEYLNLIKDKTFSCEEPETICLTEVDVNIGDGNNGNGDPDDSLPPLGDYGAVGDGTSGGGTGSGDGSGPSSPSGPITSGPITTGPCHYEMIYIPCTGNRRHFGDPSCTADFQGASLRVRVCPQTNNIVNDSSLEKAAGQSCNDDDLSLSAISFKYMPIALDFSDAEIAWLNENCDTATDVYDYWEAMEFSEEAKNEVKMTVTLKTIENRWVDSQGITPGTSRRYTHKHPVEGGTMYLLEEGGVILVSNSERAINKKIAGSIAASEDNAPYHYYYSYETDRWYEYRVAPTNYPGGDFDFLFKAFWEDGAVFVGRYIIPVEDIKIVIDGTDFDGAAANEYLAGGMLIVSIIPGGKLLTPVTRIARGTQAWKMAIKVGDNVINLSYKVVNGVVDFGSRGKLAEVIGTVAGQEAHHLLPWGKRTHQVIQEAAYDGFHMNARKNGRALEKFSALTGDGLHGNHPAYDRFVEFRLDQFEANINALSPENASEFLDEMLLPELNGHIDDAIDSGMNLNTYFREVINPDFGLN